MIYNTGFLTNSIKFLREQVGIIAGIKVCSNFIKRQIVWNHLKKRFPFILGTDSSKCQAKIEYTLLLSKAICSLLHRLYDYHGRGFLNEIKSISRHPAFVGLPPLFLPGTLQQLVVVISVLGTFIAPPSVFMD